MVKGRLPPFVGLHTVLGSEQVDFCEFIDINLNILPNENIVNIISNR